MRAIVLAAGSFLVAAVLATFAEAACYDECENCIADPAFIQSRSSEPRVPCFVARGQGEGLQGRGVRGRYDRHHR
jgi:hypothetical protein